MVTVIMMVVEGGVAGMIDLTELSGTRRALK